MASEENPDVRPKRTVRPPAWMEDYEVHPPGRRPSSHANVSRTEQQRAVEDYSLFTHSPEGYAKMTPLTHCQSNGARQPHPPNFEAALSPGWMRAIQAPYSLPSWVVLGCLAGSVDSDPAAPRAESTATDDHARHETSHRS